VNRIKYNKKKQVFFLTRAGKETGLFLCYPGFFLAISNFRSYNFILYVKKQIKK